MPYDQYLVNNLFLMNIILAVVAGTLAWRFARWLPRGLIVGVLGIIPIPVIGVILSALNVLGFLVHHYGAPALSAIGKDISGGIAFLLESGIEFGSLGIGASLLLYIAGRYRGRRRRSAGLAQG